MLEVVEETGELGEQGLLGTRGKLSPTGHRIEVLAQVFEREIEEAQDLENESVLEHIEAADGAEAAIGVGIDGITV